MSKVYLAGAISNLVDNFRECEVWRHDLKELIEDVSKNKWVAFNPIEHLEWDYETNPPSLLNGRDGGMSLDLFNLRHSDIVIADLRYPSIGTNMELAIAYEYRIPVIGFIDSTIDRTKIHPWIDNCCIEICDDVEDAMLYFINNFINGD